VETWANIPVIVMRGGKWFAGIGTASSKGTKTFCLVGNVNNTGLIEVPMGITLRQIVYDLGGGLAAGRKAKAIQTGGPSGGCIPAEEFDLPVDYESLSAAGSIMGSGGMIVMDDHTCMVDIALLSGFSRRRIVRQVLPLPRRHAAAETDPHPDY
jgi:NADH:ubiquinone oxidoreductase subunit F (NADH-binding)